MIKLQSRILHINGPNQSEFIIILAEAKTGTALTIAIQNNRGNGIEIDSAILSAINETVTELQAVIDMKNDPNDPKRVTMMT